MASCILPKQVNAATAEKSAGIVSVSSGYLNVRRSASTSAGVVSTLKKGAYITLLSKEGKWWRVEYAQGRYGYCHTNYIKTVDSTPATVSTAGSPLNVRSGAGTSNSSVTKGYKGEKAYIIGIKDGWYRIIFNDKIGYVRSDFLELTETPYENKSSAKSPKFYRGGKSLGTEPSASALNGSSASKPSGGSVSTAKVTGSQIVSKAKEYLGVPYKYGGTTPSGFDCSGFVYYVYRSLGINISRTQTAMYSQGKAIKKSELKPGDLVFFQNTYKAGISHVGIYVGDGKFIHSPSSGKVVSYADLNSSYYTSHYYGAARYTDK